jgi:murein DD-endopeptidase MepM/ murein hydrolase activator NlpD
MAAVAAMALVTSVPANAVSTDVLTAPQSASDSVTSQRIATTAADPAVIQRDDYTIRNAAEASVADKFAAVPSFASNTSSAVRWPFDGELRLSDGFGPRVSPCGGCSSFHLGTDFLPGEGNPVYAMADGVVQDVQSTGGLGEHVVIEHIIDGQIITTTSAHMQTGSVLVSIGQVVTAGQQIGRVGNTGDSTGPHLHFELRLGGTEAVDPYSWLQAHVG